MNSAQRKAVGKGFGPDIFHESTADFHPPADPETCFSDEEEQTYDEFVDMGKRRPNAQGTGRWKKTRARTKIGLVALTSDKGMTAEMRKACQILQRFLSSYLCMDVEHVPNDDVSWIPNHQAIRIGEFEYACRMGHPNSSVKANSKRKRTPGHMDVFSLFDAFKSARFVQSPFFSVLVVTSVGLVEEVDGEFSEVLGRSYPDRAACVALHKPLKSLLVTAAHELLHSMGLDHCSSFSCVMNAVAGSENWLFLSPPNLRKLKCFHGIPDSDTDFLLDRYDALRMVLKSIPGLSSDVVYLDKKIQAYRSLILQENGMTNEN
ncbi:unnamed protein product [Aphanomyces euteiches]|uniref:Peptidase M12B domain-containing protein n=1 Tax=Aphanomyces euteiches TaxID=100861 RepID=A0A6G0WJE5_9STRA|nr:hypothetical protein Ae201684_014594 [Aphanomyces euteiches]KAH9081181.1 hypothetical protein Ae201684P_012153 [Aphanomyces euteiches]